MIESEWLPNALMYGISYHDFWHLNPKKMKFYRTAYEKNINYVAWLNGCYIQRAIGSVFPKGDKYPKEPIESKASENQNIKSATDAELFELYAMKFNKQFKN